MNAYPSTLSGEEYIKTLPLLVLMGDFADLHAKMVKQYGSDTVSQLLEILAPLTREELEYVLHHFTTKERMR